LNARLGPKSASLSHAVLFLAGVGIALAAIAGLSHAIAPAMGLDEATLQWPFAMGVVIAAIRVYGVRRPRIGPGSFAQQQARMLEFERLFDEIGTVASIDALIRRAGERVDAIIEPESIVVYARADAHFTPVFSRGREPPIPSHAETSLLVHALERRAQPIRVGSSEIDGFDRAALETLGVDLIVPIRGREELVAFACLGRKPSGEPYVPQEIAQLERLASRCFEVLLRLTPARGRESASQVFRRDGELWTIASQGKEIRLRDMRGLHYLAAMLRDPGREFSAADLVGLGRGLAPGRSSEDPGLRVVRGLGDAGERIDARARAAYRERLVEVEAERADAERRGDLARLARASEEREALLMELVAACGKNAASHDERARLSVTKAIGSALAKVSERHPELGAHLSATIHRGYHCAYVPDPRVSVQWET